MESILAVLVPSMQAGFRYHLAWYWQLLFHGRGGSTRTITKESIFSFDNPVLRYAQVTFLLYSTDTGPDRLLPPGPPDPEAPTLHLTPAFHTLERWRLLQLPSAPAFAASEF
jgi:hypothetical protein